MVITSIDEGCTHQGSWGWVDVAGTAVSRTEGRCVLSKAEAEETLTSLYFYVILIRYRITSYLVPVYG